MTETPTLPPGSDHAARMVMLTYGRMEGGKSSYWCYVAVKLEEFDRFNATLKGGNLNLSTFEEDGFGEIIVSGAGLYPPTDVTREVAKMFNTPIRDLFGDVDPKAVMARKIAQLKEKRPENG